MELILEMVAAMVEMDIKHCRHHQMPPAEAPVVIPEQEEAEGILAPLQLQLPNQARPHQVALGAEVLRAIIQIQQTLEVRTRPLTLEEAVVEVWVYLAKDQVESVDIH